MRYAPAAALASFGRGGPDKPFVVGQLGQTLDGKVATPTGKSMYINGKAALHHLHRLRAACDAVLVGVGTVIADDPRLTVRHCEGGSPLRVVLDPTGRLPVNRKCLLDQAAPTLMIHREGVSAANLPAHVEELYLPADDNGYIAPSDIIAALGARGVRSILVEGGPKTLSGFLAAGALDELHVMVAPMIFGSGRDGIALPAIDGLDEALRPDTDVSLFDDGDLLFVCDLSAEANAAARPTRLASIR